MSQPPQKVRKFNYTSECRPTPKNDHTQLTLKLEELQELIEELEERVSMLEDSLPEEQEQSQSDNEPWGT